MIACADLRCADEHLGRSPHLEAQEVIDHSLQLASGEHRPMPRRATEHDGRTPFHHQLPETLRVLQRSFGRPFDHAPASASLLLRILASVRRWRTEPACA